jgi:hypothetical protein
MASNSLKSLLKKLRRDLDWPVLERPHDAPLIRIVSNTSNRSHVIFMPDKLHNRSNDLDYLHELGHAYFAEKVHPVFSANSQFARHENKRQYVNLIPALNAACDWFIGHWQLEVAPKVLRKHLEESLPVVEDVLGEANAPPLEVILDASLLIAQAIHYLDEPIDCGGLLKLAVDAFLSIPPDEPTPENCILLVNRLMATYTDHRARLVNDGEFHVWQLILPDEVSRVESAAAIVKPGEDS